MKIITTKDCTKQSFNWQKYHDVVSDLGIYQLSLSLLQWNIISLRISTQTKYVLDNCLHPIIICKREKFYQNIEAGTIIFEIRTQIVLYSARWQYWRYNSHDFRLLIFIFLFFFFHVDAWIRKQNVCLTKDNLNENHECGWIIRLECRKCSQWKTHTVSFLLLVILSQTSTHAHVEWNNNNTVFIRPPSSLLSKS